ncbi:MAG TPA: DUF6624 domain-containing protein [Blastocatellia bacterium]
MDRAFILALCWTLLITGIVNAQTRDKDKEPPQIINPALRSELLDRLEQDQNIRGELMKKGLKDPDPVLLKKMQDIDDANADRMVDIINQYGWPGPALVGRDGTEAAFVLIQHADRELQENVLPFIKRAYLDRELPGQDYALLVDRILIGKKKLQRYGTQVHFNGKEPEPDPIEDPANVDKRRAVLGMPPLADYLKDLKKQYFPDEKSQ